MKAKINFKMGLLMLSVLAMFAVDTGDSIEQRICYYTSRTVDHLSVRHIEVSSDDVDDADYGPGKIQEPNQTCPKNSNYCYALWKEDPSDDTGNGVFIIAQGCWESSGKQDCENNDCVSRKPSKALNNTNFCCCRGNFCNGNVSQMYYSDPSEPEVFNTEVMKDQKESYIFIVIALFGFFLLLTIFFILFRKKLLRKSLENAKNHPDSVHLTENGNVHASNFTLENLKLDGLIGQGKYGSVWKGSVGDQPVAVKIFPSHYRNYFYNELDIYCLPFMAHPFLLSYFGYDERTNSDGNVEYLLFLSLAPNGCLQDYLRSNVLDWNTFCKMALSVAKGVAYLHTDIHKGDKLKPCISHRDLNTKNVLVKEDLSCVICDLGFATKINGSKYYYNGEEQHAEMKSINDVGTLRYMSPEILEGAVNLRDCETSLKQIDVYALGLILWEISSRCTDFYPQGVECAPYKLPFEAEIGHPTFEQMQILVCKHKARPLFPDLWRDSPAVRTVKETIEDCWDQDAEARLTALCVEERFHELCGITDRQKVCLYPSGVSPTARTSVIHKESHNVLIVSENKEGDSCMSESTMDTLLAITPANPQANCKNSNQFQGICPSVQPYQGRNPCLERNLMLPHDHESNSSTLIDKSHKHIVSDGIESSSLVNEYLQLYSSNPTHQNFVNPSYNGYSNQSEPMLRTNVPIPFLQNVNNSENMAPKLSNIPKPATRGKRINWKNFKKVFEKRKIDDVSPQIDCNAKSNLIANENGAVLSTPTASFETKFETRVDLTDGKTEIKIAPTANDDSKYSTTVKIVDDRDVSLLGTQNNRRPNTLPLLKPGEFQSGNNGKGRNNVRNVDKLLRNIERSNAKQKTNLEGAKKRRSLGVKNDSREERNAKTRSLSEIDELKILRLETKIEEAFNKNLKILDTVSQKSLVRPNEERANESSPKVTEENKDKTCTAKDSRPNTSQNCKVSLEEVFTSKSDGTKLKDPSSRIKTPGDVPIAVRKIRSERNTARFSLYDDRIMSGYYENDTLYGYTNNRKLSGEYDQIFSSFEDIKFSQNI